MVPYSDDVAVAVDLASRIDLADWPRLMDGPSHSQPYLYGADHRSLLLVQAWLAGHAAEATTMVRCAIANFLRVLNDFLYVFEYDLEWRKPDCYWVRKWYHPSLGGSGDPLDGERYGVHVLLIRNLAAELTRAMNLIVMRVRSADERALRGLGLATIDTGALDAPYQVARYSDREAADAQPYPGLAEFPLVIEGRDVGALGASSDRDVPRTAVAFADWVAHLAGELGVPPGGSAPEVAKDLPLALARPVNDSGSGVSRFGITSPWVLAPFGAISVVGVVGSVTASPVLLGSAVGAVVPSFLLAKLLWRTPPVTWAVAVVVLAATAGGVVALLLKADSSTESQANAPRAGRGLGKRPGVLSRPVGQVLGGDIVRARKGERQFGDPVRVSIGQRWTVGMRLSNSGPDPVTDVRVAAKIPSVAASSLSVQVAATGGNLSVEPVGDTVTMRIAGGPPGCLVYVPGSTRAADAGHGVVAAPAGSLLGEGVLVNRVEVGTLSNRYVLFDVDVAPAESGPKCS